MLFHTISDIVTPAPPSVSISFDFDCEHFLSFFLEKVSHIRGNISPLIIPHLSLRPYLLLPTNKEKSTLLHMLVITSVFDTIDLRIYSTESGGPGSALLMFSSYIRGHSFSAS